MTRDVLHIIQENMTGFSKGQRRIAGYILSDYDKAAFMTANKLGTVVGVSESTVVRFAAELGYDGYPAMQKALQEIVRSKLTSIQRIRAYGGGPGAAGGNAVRRTGRGVNKRRDPRPAPFRRRPRVL